MKIELHSRAIEADTCLVRIGAVVAHVTEHLALTILRHRTAHAQADDPVSKCSVFLGVFCGGKSSHKDEAAAVVELAHPIRNRRREYWQWIIRRVYFGQ